MCPKNGPSLTSHQFGFKYGLLQNIKTYHSRTMPTPGAVAAAAEECNRITTKIQPHHTVSGYLTL
jgi:hypothetical protein